MAAGNFALRFASWCSQTCTVEPFTGSDGYGAPEYGAGIQMSCNLQPRVRMVTDIQGRQRVSTSTLYVLGGPLDPRDRITPPAGYGGPAQPPVVSVANWTDKDGSFSHAEVML